MNLKDVTWPEAILELTKLGGAVLVACFALWLYVPAMQAQHERLLQSQQADRELVQQQVTEIHKRLDSILERLNK